MFHKLKWLLSISCGTLSPEISLLCCCFSLYLEGASLTAQLVKNLSARQETPVWFLGWEDLLGEGKGYPLQYSGLENSMDYVAHGVAQSRTRLSGCYFSTWNAPSHPPVEPLAFKPCGVWCLSPRIILGSRGGTPEAFAGRKLCLRKRAGPSLSLLAVSPYRRRHDSFDWRNWTPSSTLMFLYLVRLTR